MPRTVILSSARTPIGKLGGGLSTLPATHLGGVAIREALQRADVEPEQVEHVVMGTVLLPGARQGFRMGDVKALDAMIEDGLRNPFTGKQMFEEATEVGDELEMTRADLDKWALRSHERTIAATDDGRLPEEMVPVTVKGRKGDTVVEVDEAPRRDSSLEALAKLPGLAHKEGSHTAGNSPGVNDGAGALVFASDEWAEREGKEILAEIISQAAVADEFEWLARP